MKTKILIILIILVSLGVGGFFVYKNILVPEAEKEKKEIYKGIWLPTLSVQDPNHLASNIQKLKDIGINTIFIQAFPPNTERWLEKANFPPELIKKIEEVIPIEKELIIANIQTAHRNGLKVGLTMTNPSTMGEKLEEIDLEALNSKIVEYAKLAEEYDVELFAPMNEPENILSKNTGKWRQEILPKIKEVYHGEVVWKGAMLGPRKTLSEEFLEELSEGPPGDFSGYGYIGFTLLPEGQTLEEYSQYVFNALKYVLALAERDNCKGVIIKEFGVADRFFMGESGVVDMLDMGWLSEEELARANEIVLEKGRGRVVGFINANFLGGEIPGRPGEYIEGVSEAEEEVIKKWFKEIL